MNDIGVLMNDIGYHAQIIEKYKNPDTGFAR